MKFIKIFAVVLLAFFALNVHSVSATDVSASTTVTVTAPQADLYAGPTTQPSSYLNATVGVPFTMSSTIYNGGTASASNFPYFFHIGLNGPDGGDGINRIELPYSNIGSLAAGASTGVSGSYTFTSAGTHSFQTVVDLTSRNPVSGGVVTESNEGNNWSWWTNVTVGAAAPTISTTSVSSVTQTSASSGGNITSDGGSSVTARGVVWSTSSNPTISSYLGKTTNGTGTGSFSSSITGLSCGTTYHVRSYATNGITTSYGSDISFTTSVCSVNCVGGWVDTSTCSVSCGWGVKLQQYSITTPASGGGTSCPYSNGATQWGSTSCYPQACPVMSGSITANNCSISTGSSSCNSSLSWSTSNPEATSSVTTPTGITVATANSGSTSYSVAYGTRTFYLYNNGSLLSTSTATASCVGGTTWTGVCSTIPSGSITAPNCTISAGNSSCSPSITWSTTNPIGTSSVTTPTGITVATANSSAGTSYSVAYGSRTFYLYNFGYLLGQSTSTASCVAGTTWNGSSCALNSYTVSTSVGAGGSISPTSASVTGGNTTSFTISPNSGYSISSATGCGGGLSGNTYTTGAITSACTVSVSFVATPTTGTINSTACNVSVGSSTCNTTLTWSTTNPVSTSTVTTPTGITVATANSSAGTSYAIDYGTSRTFYLYNNGVLISQATVAAPSCTGGATWTGSVCSTIPSGSITAPNCTISAGNSSCSPSMTWSTTNPIGTSSVTTPTGITVATANSSAGTSYSVAYGSRTFYLYNFGYLLGQSTSTASCAGGTTWDGSKCAAASGNISATACSIPIGASVCTSTVSWSISNPISPSVRQDGTQFSSLASSSASRSVSYGSSTFSIYDSGNLLNSTTSSASCVGGSAWTGSACATTPSGSITASNCTIIAGNDSCNTTLTWSTVGPIGTSSVTTPTSITVASANSSLGTTYPVSYGSRTFYLYNFGNLLAQATASNSCEIGSTWNGSICLLDNIAPNAPTISGSSAFFRDISQTFSVTGTDGDGDTIRYGIDWNNDDVAETWTSPYVASGTVMFPSNSWTSNGTFSFKALTQDLKGANSPWSSLFNVTVTEPPVAASITSFKTSKDKVEVGQPVTLTWNSSNATNCSMSSTPAPSVSITSLAPSTTNNSITFKPTKTTVYSLDCSGPGGPAPTAKITVTVGKIKPVLNEF